MKTITSISVFILALVLIAPAGLSAQQNSKTDTVKIMTSAECEMCKTRLEKELSLTKGVKKATLDLVTKEVSIIYNSAKTSPEKLRTVISAIGYDADDVKANNRAQKKLPNCCQPGNMPKADSVGK